MGLRISMWQKIAKAVTKSGADWRQGACLDQRKVQEKMLRQEMWSSSRRMRSSGCRWETSCCGIFCGPWEGSEGIGEVSGDLWETRKVPDTNHVPVFRRISQRSYIKWIDKPDRNELLAVEIARCQEHS